MEKTRNAQKADKKYMAPRVSAFQIVWPGKETHDAWLAISEDVLRAWNLCWRVWVLWHEQQGTVPRIKDFQSTWTAWKKEGGEKPQPFDKPVPKECSQAINRRLSSELPQLNATVTGMVSNGWQNELHRRKAARGSWAGWMQILLAKEGIPSYTHAQPIPIKNTDTLAIRKVTETGDYEVAFRIDRIPVEGKKRAVSTLYTVKLKSRTRKMRGQRAILDRVVSGEYKLCACNLQYSDSRREWDFLLTYRIPQFDRTVSTETQAILVPDREHPWSLFVKGKRYWVDGRGRIIGESRRRIMGQRRNRQATYRVAGSSNKGHGRKRALAPMEALQKAWKHLVMRVNHTTTKRVVDKCVELGAGRLVYLKPVDSRRNSRFLAWTGKEEDCRDASAWDWRQVETYLGYKCQAAGILLEVKAWQPRRRQQVATAQVEETSV